VVVAMQVLLVAIMLGKTVTLILAAVAVPLLG